jgi:hypothetical protein
MDLILFIFLYLKNARKIAIVTSISSHHSVQIPQGDFFGFEHDAKANGFNVWLIWGFQDMPSSKKLVETYSIGSPTTIKTIKQVHCMAKIN